MIVGLLDKLKCVVSIIRSFSEKEYAAFESVPSAQKKKIQQILFLWEREE